MDAMVWSQAVYHTLAIQPRCVHSMETSALVALVTPFGLTTGFQNAAVLGVNSPETFLFRRSTTCAPVIVNDTYAKIVNISTGPAKWRYNYGNQGDTNYTFETSIKDFDAHFVAYIVA
jgi:hypothetical protein